MADFKIDSTYALDKNGYTMSYPVGTIMGIFSSTIPDGWLLCNGATLNYSDYPTLGTLFGVSSGTFSLPDLNNKMLSTIATSEATIATTHTHTTSSSQSQVISTTLINAHTHNSTVNHTAGDMAAHSHTAANGSGHSYGNNNNNLSNRATGNTTFVAGGTHNHNYMEYWVFLSAGGASNAHQHTAKSVPVNASYNHTHTYTSSETYSAENTAFPSSLYIYYIIKS